MFKEILRINSSEFFEILKNPSTYLFESYSLEFTNNQIYAYEPIENIHKNQILNHSKIPADITKKISKEEIKEHDLPDNQSGLNDIGSNSIIQKIDLANAYLNMGKTNLAKKILQRLESASLTKNEKKELNKLKKQLNDG